jgi:hypothetical protein
MSTRVVSIYALVVPGTADIRYVGKTEFSLRRRLGWHMTAVRRGSQLHVHRWMRKLGSPPDVILLEAVSDDRWAAAEREWIAHYRRGGRLTNMTDGGEVPSRVGCAHSPETRALLAEAMRRRVLTPVHRRRIAEAMTGKNQSPEALANFQRTISDRRALTRCCIHNHEFTVANTYIDRRGVRRCRKCDAIRKRASRQRPVK